MAEKSTFPVNSTVLYNKWELSASSVVDTRQTEGRGREEESVGCGGGTGNAGGEELAQVLLGQGGKDRGIYPESDRRESVGT